MTRQPRAFIPLLVLSLVLSLPVSAHCAEPVDPAFAPGIEKLTSLIKKEMGKHVVKGLAIAVVDHERLVWAEGFGMADEARGLPMQPDTIVNLGSGAKLFTSMGAMALAGQGRLDLDAPASRVLPGLNLAAFAQDAGKVTPRRLMTHHAGLPANYLKGLYTKSNQPQPLTVRMLTDTHMAFSPGTVFSFSNLGTAILGMAVEKTAGESFSPWMDKSVFAPLGMPDTSYQPKDEWTGRMAVSYGARGSMPTPHSNQTPAVSLFTTAQDQARFLEVLLGSDAAALPPGISRKALSGMLDPQNASVALDMDLRVGLGWNLNRPAFGPAGTVAWNFGRLAGFRSLMLADREAGLGVVVLANSSSAETPRDSMIDRVADEAMRMALAAKGMQVKPVTQAACNLISPDQAAGSYATILGVVAVSQDKGKLTIRLEGKNLDLVPCAEGVYDVSFQMMGITLYDVTKNQAGLKFSFEESGGRTYLVLHQWGERELFGVKVDPFPITPAWEARLGKWVLENLGDDLPLVREVTLLQKDGLVLYETKLPSIMDFKLSIPLIALGDDWARVAGPGGFSQSMGDQFHFASGLDGERLLYGGFVFKKKS